MKAKRAVAGVVIIMGVIGMRGNVQARDGSEAAATADYATFKIWCLYYPGWHTSGRALGWESIKAAKSRGEWHCQPLIPLWGYQDESDPMAFEVKIDAAADHGIDAFLFYWYYTPELCEAHNKQRSGEMTTWDVWPEC